MRIVLFAALVIAGCGGGGGGGAGASTPPPPTSTVGWTEFTPSPDTQTIHVSSSTGNDANNGLTPATAVSTLARGYALMRTGFPDWMLLRAGDAWNGENLNWRKSGRSTSEPMLVWNYGAGPRPLVRNGEISFYTNTAGIRIDHVAFADIDFYASARDPLSPDYGTVTPPSNAMFLLGPCGDILVEGCSMRFYNTNVAFQEWGPGGGSNLRVRRCVITDSYGVAGTSHSQGLYAHGHDGLLIEECVFDHNGWHGTPPNSQATMFNHNTYINGQNTTLRNNMFLRASSMANKFRCDTTGAFANLTVEDNLYVEGEIGIGVGGNTADPLRFRNVNILNNVLIHIGRTQPTGRAFAWHIDVLDNDGGAITGNYCLHQPTFTNCFGVSLTGVSNQNLTIANNFFYRLAGRSIAVSRAAGWGAIAVSNNVMQDAGVAGRMTEHAGGFGGFSYSGNTYSSSAAASAWFRIDGTNASLATWTSLSGETGATAQTLAYVDPNRDPATYNGSLGGGPTFDAFIAEARAQSRTNWRPAYTASAVNAYIRAGFAAP